MNSKDHVRYVPDYVCYCENLSLVPNPETEVEIIDDLIISLTSYPPRINYVKYTIASLLLQKRNDKYIRPKELILWLAEEEFPDRKISEELEKMCTIQWCENLRSYKKIVPVIPKNENHYILNVDDDCFYLNNFLETFLTYRDKNPKNIIFTSGCQYEPMVPYVDWKYIWHCKNIHSKFSVCPCGVGGIMYPPKSIPKFAANTVSQVVAKNDDDIWMWFMCVLNGTEYTGISPNNKLLISPCRKKIEGNASIVFRNIQSLFPELNFMRKYKCQYLDRINIKNIKSIHRNESIFVIQTDEKTFLYELKTDKMSEISINEPIKSVLMDEKYYVINAGDIWKSEIGSGMWNKVEFQMKNHVCKNNGKIYCLRLGIEEYGDDINIVSDYNEKIVINNKSLKVCTIYSTVKERIVDLSFKEMEMLMK